MPPKPLVDEVLAFNRAKRARYPTEAPYLFVEQEGIEPLCIELTVYTKEFK